MSSCILAHFLISWGKYLLLLGSPYWQLCCQEAKSLHSFRVDLRKSLPIIHFSVFHSVPVIVVLYVQYYYYLLRSTVVTLKTTPFSQRIIKRRCENGQFPMVSPSLPAWVHTNQRHGSIFKSNCALKKFFSPLIVLIITLNKCTSTQPFKWLTKYKVWSWRFCQHTVIIGIQSNTAILMCVQYLCLSLCAPTVETGHCNETPTWIIQTASINRLAAW